MIKQPNKQYVGDDDDDTYMHSLAHTCIVLRIIPYQYLPYKEIYSGYIMCTSSHTAHHIVPVTTPPFVTPITLFTTPSHPPAPY